MFSSFWDWVIIVIVLTLIFGANHLHLWKALASKKIEHLKQTAIDKKNDKESTSNKPKKDK